MAVAVNVSDSLLVPEQENNHGAASPDHETQTYKVHCEVYGHTHKPYNSVWVHSGTVSIIYFYAIAFIVCWTSDVQNNRDIYQKMEDPGKEDTEANKL